MSEKSPNSNLETNGHEIDSDESINKMRLLEELLSRGREGIDKLSPGEREQLLVLGNYFLGTENDYYRAKLAFNALQDFAGLRKTADRISSGEQPDSNWDLTDILTCLEDYEGLRERLNRFYNQFCYYAFAPLSPFLGEYIKTFLEKNNTPVATGILNEEDLIAIRNLAKEWDVAVPIARGGLKQGAIAQLWGMPTRILDLHAHKRKTPTSQWINRVAPEDFEGKRVLLFDKDAVTGATVREAVRILNDFKIARIGIYFAYNSSTSEYRIGTHLENLPSGIEILYPANAPLQNAGDALIEAHERLGTLYGRRRQIQNLLTVESQIIKDQFPELSEALMAFVSEGMSAFDSLNPILQGISDVREKILSIMTRTGENLRDLLKNGVFSAFPNSLKNSIENLRNTRPLYPGYETDLVRARYARQAEELAQKRKVSNPHNPSSPLTAFNAARRAVQDGYDFALIVGPEGFAYEPYFLDLGLPTVAVNIPESRPDERRTMKKFDDLSVLEGKRVLVVEDDVRTGATLEKLIKHLKRHSPGSLGLYLGQPKNFQELKNVPSSFVKTYMAGDDTYSPAEAKEFREYLESRGLRIFKTRDEK